MRRLISHCNFKMMGTVNQLLFLLASVFFKANPAAGQASSAQPGVFSMLQQPYRPSLQAQPNDYNAPSSGSINYMQQNSAHASSSSQFVPPARPTILLQSPFSQPQQQQNSRPFFGHASIFPTNNYDSFYAGSAAPPARPYFSAVHANGNPYAGYATSDWRRSEQQFQLNPPQDSPVVPPRYEAENTLPSTHRSLAPSHPPPFSGQAPISPSQNYAGPGRMPPYYQGPYYWQQNTLAPSHIYMPASPVTPEQFNDTNPVSASIGQASNLPSQAMANDNSGQWQIIGPRPSFYITATEATIPPRAVDSSASSKDPPQFQGFKPISSIPTMSSESSTTEATAPTTTDSWSYPKTGGQASNEGPATRTSQEKQSLWQLETRPTPLSADWNVNHPTSTPPSSQTLQQAHDRQFESNIHSVNNVQITHHSVALLRSDELTPTEVSEHQMLHQNQQIAVDKSAIGNKPLVKTLHIHNGAASLAVVSDPNSIAGVMLSFLVLLLALHLQDCFCIYKSIS